MDGYSVLKKFRRQKVMTVEQLMQIIQCSAITVRRRLKQWDTFTSINKNGRYYTLPKIPGFDENGLWRYQTVLFSVHGNLKQTIIQLIRQSSSGLSATDISSLIGVPPNSSYFSQIKNSDGIKREKYQGRFIYFSDNDQYLQLKYKKTEGWPTDAQAVDILVHLIKNPGISLERLSVEAAPPGKHFDFITIKQFLLFHDLLKKIADTGL